jgi:hypothetical protein
MRRLSSLFEGTVGQHKEFPQTCCGNIENGNTLIERGDYHANEHGRGMNGEQNQAALWNPADEAGEEAAELGSPFTKAQFASRQSCVVCTSGVHI